MVRLWGWEAISLWKLGPACSLCASLFSCHPISPKCLGSHPFFAVRTWLHVTFYLQPFGLPSPICNKNNHVCFLSYNSNKAEIVTVLFIMHIKYPSNDWYIVGLKKKKKKDHSIKQMEKKKVPKGTWVAQWLSVCLRHRSWSRGPGIESCIGFPAWSFFLLLPMSLPLSLSLLWINK